jgi:predicted N-acetyltransferase YhbS
VLSAQRVAASNNILTGGNPSLQITAPENKYTVLGNVTSSPITVDNQTLAGVWGALNVHA